MCFQPSLIDLPYVVITKLLEVADFRSILVLQKVTSGLRNFIEDICPETHLKSISITLSLDSIYISMDPFLDWSIDVEYRKQENGCSVQYGMSKEHFLMNHDYLSIFLNDFQVNLKNQKSILELLRISFEYFLEGFLLGIKEVLESRESPLKVRELEFEVKNQEEVMSVLPYVDSKSLHKISISSPDYLIDLKMDQIVQLEQWREVKELEMFNCVVSEPLTNFSHFRRAKMCVQSISSEDLFMLKEEFLASPNFESSTIKYKLFEENIFLTQLFGDPVIQGRDSWAFPCEDSDQSIQLTHYRNQTFCFSRVKSCLITCFYDKLV
ncbi:hypothetical protein CRE_08973 [Caenorhabditis remanei]|uniref:Uncharacterized protein n=1 Tax=Caenorhabditis remanei TaxID=31234 RepID=E3LIK0_CAERE|nr:hypothetical protein CRE_08973 [Caenorhabditis remanei]